LYEGEWDFDKFPARVSYWDVNCLVVPNWFDSEKAARDYVAKVNRQIMRTYNMVQECHYPKGDSRVTSAKIIGSFSNDFYPPPSKKNIKEQGEATIEIWTMYFPDRESAIQYVDTLNSDASAVIALNKPIGNNSFLCPILPPGKRPNPPGLSPEAFLII
jgi:hypothetical protein